LNFSDYGQVECVKWVMESVVGTAHAMRWDVSAHLHS
jgi:hypothetical protein